MAAADFVVVIHVFVLAYMVFGGFLALRRLAWIWPHLGMILWSVYVTLASFTCPLTSLEKWLLERGGDVPYEGSFIGHYMRDTFYPAQYELAIWLSMIGLALVSYAVAFSRRRPVVV
jgi:uncharacterized protein DUF2784